MAIKSATVRAATGVKPVGTNTSTGQRNTPAPATDYSQRNNTLYARLNLNNQGARTPTTTAQTQARDGNSQYSFDKMRSAVREDMQTENTIARLAMQDSMSAQSNYRGKETATAHANSMEVYGRNADQEQKVYDRTNKPTFIDSGPKDLNGRFMGDVRNSEEGRQHEMNMLGKQGAVAQAADARKYQFQVQESKQDRASAERLGRIQSEAQQNAALYSGLSSLANRQYNWQYWGG